MFSKKPVLANAMCIVWNSFKEREYRNPITGPPNDLRILSIRDTGSQSLVFVFLLRVPADQARAGFKIVKLKMVHPAHGFHMSALHPYTLSLNMLSYCRLGPLTHSFISTFSRSVIVLTLAQFRKEPLLHSQKYILHLLSLLRVKRFLVQVSGSFAHSIW